MVDSSRIAASILALGGAELGSRGLAFIAAAYLARVLLPAGFGIVGFATAVAGYFALAVTAGFNEIGAREVARRPERVAALAEAVIVIRLALAVGAMALLALVSGLLHKPAPVRLVVLLAGLSFFALALDTGWVYKGRERSGRVAGALLLGQLIYLGMVLFLVRRPDDVARVPVAQFAGDLTAALVLAFPLLRPRAAPLDLRAGWSLLRQSGSLTLSRLLRTVIFTADVVLIGLMLEERAVGIYTAAYRIGFLLLALAVTVQVSFLPAASRAALRSPGELRGVAEHSLAVSATIGAPLVIGGWLLAGQLLAAVFGPAYVTGAGAFRLILLSVGCMFASLMVHNILLTTNRIRGETALIGGMAALNLSLNLLVIPRWGLVGAAATTALCEGLILTGGMALARGAGAAPSLGPLWRPLFASGVMAACLTGLGPARPLWITLPVGAGSYSGVLALLGGFRLRGGPGAGPSLVAGVGVPERAG